MEQLAAGTDGPSVTYHIGENALDEIPSDQLKAFIDQVGTALPRTRLLRLICAFPRFSGI